ncbi:GNAT family N-acetyltransferase [Paracoccus aminophilus]|uniref:GCN5-related N-acetyltransferase n=1 Tax=Paracoccus aminophilus JCM 7686 TaxID=1367847 RepID=S5Y556_PARAH|nr:GNAT family N-acetyltransferase [Paracoccus aminophilus]AGT10865.1 GCN5-related N-acetyltransferase [Paracoccus aminophilus JCM 7686]
MTDILLSVPSDSPEARPVFAGLVEEYGKRYNKDGGPPRSVESEIAAYPPALFHPPLGDFLILQRDGETIAGGAFMSHDDETVEIKRIWTHPGLRRQGLSRRIMAALEDRAAELGYTRAYLTTGHRQPEAQKLYLSHGYHAFFGLSDDLSLYGSLPFEKRIGRAAGQVPERARRIPSASPEDAAEVVTAIKAAQAELIFARLARHQERRSA